MIVCLIRVGFVSPLTRLGDQTDLSRDLIAAFVNNSWGDSKAMALEIEPSGSIVNSTRTLASGLFIRVLNTPWRANEH